MILQQLRLISFRAHSDVTLEFSPKVNLIYGPNGIGKTNLLEAIHYLALSKSFLISNDQYALRKGANFFELNASFTGTHRRDLKVRLAYVPDEGKRLFVNNAPLERLSQIVGTIPIVVFAPSDHAITADGPEVRRRFINNILSQAKPVYLDDMMKYRRALKQRNVLLMQYRRSHNLPGDLLQSWNEELIQLGSRIIAERLRFTHTFSGFLEEAYKQISEVGERPKMKYQTIETLHPELDETSIASLFRKKIEHAMRREKETGRTLVGPHRDELNFKLNDLEVRRYASQGQHQTFGMALKLAQYFYLQEKLDEPPILLLDDLFGNLDEKRTRIFLQMLQTDTVGQCLITAAQDGPFRKAMHFDGITHRAINLMPGAQPISINNEHDQVDDPK